MGLFDKINPLKVVGDIIDNDNIFEASVAAVSAIGQSVESSVHSAPAPPPIPAGVPSPLSVMVLMNGQQYGPYDRAALIDMINSGTLTRDTYVYIQGMSSWLPACNVPEVCMLFGVRTPPTPPMPFSPVPPAVPQQASKPNNGMSDKLNSLIEAAVADGEITDIERQVLIRNAQAEGVSMDEFVVVLEARLFEQRKKLETEQRSVQTPLGAPAIPPAVPGNGNTVKIGELRKCPACLAIINKIDACECPQCGYEFRNAVSMANSGNPIQSLVDKLDAIDNEMSSMNSFTLVFRQEQFEKRKVSAISTFIVPNNKSAMTNFLMLASSTYATTSKFDPIRKAWKNKAEEVMKRVKAVYSSDMEMMQVLESSAKTFGIKVKNL